MNESLIKNIAEGVLRCDCSDIRIIDSDGVYAAKKDGKRTAGGADIPQKLRAISLLTLNGGKEAFEIYQKPRFSKLGAMLDMSRGGVMRVEWVKEYIKRLALFGANEFMLYTEDTYTLEEYPFFGYMRGAYTDRELREIDDFAFSLDIEAVPCIQTLGHLSQYLSWSEAEAIRDNESVLLCDEDKTYRFIEAQIAKMRKIFRSKKIHIGMDEAHGVGLGKYLEKHGYVNRFEIISRHLKRVSEICKKYGFEPMIWSDMFFRIGSPTGDYYDYDGEFSKSVKRDIPDVSLVYWDYYHETDEIYKKMLARHRELNRPIVFAGGIWTWTGFLPDTEKTFRTMLPALRVCADEGIDNVIAAMWGDDGCETDYFRALPGFAIFSENCYCGSGVSRGEIEKIGALISGIPPEASAAVSVADSEVIGLAKRLIWGDFFYNLSGIDFSAESYISKLEEACGCPELKDDEFAYLILETAAIKAMVYAKLNAEYRNGEPLNRYTDRIIPELLESYKRLYALHSANWHRLNKAYGFEVIEGRYAASVHRLEYAKEVIENYICGKTDRIEELEYEPRYADTAFCRNAYYNYAALSYIPPI